MSYLKYFAFVQFYLIIYNLLIFFFEKFCVPLILITNDYFYFLFLSFILFTFMKIYKNSFSLKCSLFLTENVGICGNEKLIEIANSFFNNSMYHLKQNFSMRQYFVFTAEIISCEKEFVQRGNYLTTFLCVIFTEQREKKKENFSMSQHN
ncbi:unknown membrane protein [Reticulomyxa filosa]|uniref:Transmembrane protein n=1 Tax=Reticulomyxa filosa TaxID=46433 RepID=X6MQI8_RETFI|nr:unknown membrane protein [Reticulomyxa filosa]|eukprot:ETO15712.1 unknown membrane protein [Reticulomyxa filosa]